MLALTWPIVEALIKFLPLQIENDNLKGGTLLALANAHQSLRQFDSMVFADPNSLYRLTMSPAEYEKTREEIKARTWKDAEEILRLAENDIHRQLRIAKILLHMDHDLKFYLDSTSESNKQRTETSLCRLSSDLSRLVPENPYASSPLRRQSGPPALQLPCTHADFPLPSIEVRPQEKPLEKYNRLYNLLRYLQVSTKNCTEEGSLWSKRFATIEAIMDGEVVEPDNIPVWVKPFGYAFQGAITGIWN